MIHVEKTCDEGQSADYFIIIISVEPLAVCELTTDFVNFSAKRIY